MKILIDPVGGISGDMPAAWSHGMPGRLSQGRPGTAPHRLLFLETSERSVHGIGALHLRLQRRQRRGRMRSETDLFIARWDPRKGHCPLNPLQAEYRSTAWPSKRCTSTRWAPSTPFSALQALRCHRVFQGRCDFLPQYPSVGNEIEARQIPPAPQRSSSSREGRSGSPISPSSLPRRPVPRLLPPLRKRGRFLRI